MSHPPFLCAAKKANDANQGRIQASHQYGVLLLLRSTESARDDDRPAVNSAFGKTQ
jgi:hypothetical protein